jgi:hypothetical protein
LLIGVRVEFSASGGPAEDKQFFFEKRTKKLFLITGARYRNARPNKQKFLLLFSKRSAFLLPMCQPHAVPESPP